MSQSSVWLSFHLLLFVASALSASFICRLLARSRKPCQQSPAPQSAPSLESSPSRARSKDRRTTRLKIEIPALLAVLSVFAATASAQSERPSDAVVRLTSHGGSGTVIATGEGWSLILTCYHCFNGGSRSKAVAIDMPHPAPGEAKKVGVKVIALGSMDNDLALLQLNAGPLPYVSPVAPVGFKPRDCWSCGYDEMKTPAKVRPATVVATWGGTYKTDTRPWHGRSGGGLIDKEKGYLVGVCSAYTGPSNRAEVMRGENGIYVSLPAIQRFLAKAKVMKGDTIPDERPEPKFSPFRQH